jgi:two-component system, chemotaxis family, CheB/CheR fusion protein
MAIHKGKLLLLNPAQPRGYRMPIDYFFQSLAEDQLNRSVGIILSGMGADGELGVKLIKEKLGMSMVQDPDTAEYSSMPKNAIATNFADYVLPPEEMPVKLIQYLSHPVVEEDGMPELKDNHTIQKILMLLRSQTGHDFSLYKKNTITRRIDRRLAFHQLPDYAHYVNFLRENPHELSILFNELLIGVTRFFRDHAAFEVLQQKLAAMIKTKSKGETFRVWVSACSTGEEAYSVAMILSECISSIKTAQQVKIQIFATDIDLQAIEYARQGVYKENLVADVSPARVERFFIKKNDSYVVKKELREMIVFAQHDIIKDAPFTKLDLLCCRNLLIYLSSELQKKLIPVFHYSLNYNGLLFLGPSETIGLHSDLFSVIDSKWKMFERKEGISAGKAIDFPFHVNRHSNQAPIISLPKHKGDSVSQVFNKILLDEYTPPSVIINEKGDILYINGKMGRYLELSSGEVMINVYRMAREELKYAIGNVIHQARRQKGNAIITDIRIKDEDEMRKLDIKASYVESLQQGLVILVFEDKGILTKPDSKAKKKSMQDPAMAELEKELLYTKQQLHTTIEQMETSLEELKSTNEELQSTNEELQSTNEESLTTKEEMQSLNEELMSINQQYQTKAEELTQLNNDMKNLLDGTEIGTLFLDNDLRILKFTPQLQKNFRIIKSDIGRSISDIAPNFNYPALEQSIREVIERLSSREIEVELFDKTWYTIRIMPYRTLDNFINGAVLSFINTTKFRILENQIKLLHEAMGQMLNAGQEKRLIIDAEDGLIACSDSLLSEFGMRNTATLKSILKSGDYTSSDVKTLGTLLEKAMKRPTAKFKEALKLKNGKKLSCTTLKIKNKDYNNMGIVLLTVNEGK